MNNLNDECCDIIFELINFFYTCIAVLINFKLNNWNGFKHQLLDKITNGMEEQRLIIKEYEYLRRYNDLKKSIELMEYIKNYFDIIIEVEITTECNIIITLMQDDIFNNLSNQSFELPITA